MWIKICGMTTEHAVAAALEARADAIGFVFAASSRQVTPAEAARLAACARGRIGCVAVTRHPSQDLVDQIVSIFRPDALQTDIDDLDKLRLPQSLARLPVLRTDRAETQPLPARVLFEGPASGTGVACDWRRARDIARRTQLVLAGGLNEHNVALAIESVRPFGVDASSGVEDRPGVKSAEKLTRFVQAARTAFHSLGDRGGVAGEEKNP